MVCVRGMRVRVCECGAENKAKQQNARFSSSSDSVCRYNCLFNIATPYYATFYDLLVRACSLNSTFLSNDRSLTCFITGKWRRRLLYSRTIKYCFAQIPSWDIKQNECCPPSCVYHIILKVKTWPYVFFPERRDVGKNEVSLPLIQLALLSYTEASKGAVRISFQSSSFSKAIPNVPFFQIIMKNNIQNFSRKLALSLNSTFS